MRSGVARGESGAPGVTRRVIRLFLLLGVAVAVYLVLSLLDHAARADPGSKTVPLSSAKTTAATAEKSISKPKPATPIAHPARIHRPTTKTAKAHSPKTQASKKTQAPKTQELRTGDTVRRPQARTSKLRRPTSDAIRDTARTTATPARPAAIKDKTAGVRQKAAGVREEAEGVRERAEGVRERAEGVRKMALGVRPKLSPLADATVRPDLPQAVISALPQLPSWPMVSSWPQPQLASWPMVSSWPQPQLPSWTQLRGLPSAQLAAWPQVPSWSQMPVPLQAPAPASTATAALTSGPVPQQPVRSSASAQVCPLPQPSAFASAPGLSGGTKPPAEQAQPRTAPLPAPARQPADNSTPAGQARDSGGGNAPAMGTLASSWRPGVAVTDRGLASDLFARGRTSRYAGPPS
jgi:hypothetical protein